MKLDILVFAAHPDDAELGCSGTILKEIANDKKVGICDLTQGEMGTRGSREIRLHESEIAKQILGLTIRENLNLGDCFFEINKQNTLKLVEVIRKFKPDVVITNAKTDRHPDHGKGFEIAELACFWSGLQKIETKFEAWRPNKVYNYIQDQYIEPDFVIDITPYFETKMDSIKAFSSQFYNPNSDEKESYISSKEFLKFIDARAREFGHKIGCKYGEGFTSSKAIELKNI